MWHGGGWFMYMRSGDEKPKVTRELLLRVLAYTRGYWWHIAGMLITILLTTGLSLLTPLIFRNMIDVVIPAKDTGRLILLGVALLAIPAVSGGINVIQRRLNATVGEGVIYDLRSALFRATAADVAALLHEHQSRGVDVPSQQRRGRRAERNQQYHRQYCDQHH